MTLVVGTKGYDSANSIDPKTAFSDGGRFQMRYSAGAGNSRSTTAWKLCKTDEIQSILASGSAFGANSEWYETRCTEGAAAGTEDGVADLEFWKSRGLPPGSSIYISWDSAPNSSQFGAVKAYVEAYNKALGGYYVADGLYAGIPALVWMSANSITRHGWIPEAASWSSPKTLISQLYAPPAVNVWDLWFPTPSQISPAIKYLNGLLANGRLDSCVWQCGNKEFGGAADVNYVNIANGKFGFVLPETPSTPTPAPTPAPTPHPTPQKLYQGLSVPVLIHQGSGQYFGSISGPAESHGGYNLAERPMIKILQQRLIACGFVHGVSDPHSGWADGIFDTPADRPGTGATSMAVTRFQWAHMPNTKFHGQVWWDDWTKLFSL